MTGTLTAVASSGVATFSGLAAPTLAQTGLKLTFTDGSLASAVDATSITVTAATASKLVMKTEPSSSVDGGRGILDPAGGLCGRHLRQRGDRQRQHGDGHSGDGHGSADRDAHGGGVQRRGDVQRTGRSDAGANAV